MKPARRLSQAARSYPAADVVDIHCHILPGIDDGPRDLGAAIEMARVAAESGLTTIAATPHLRADFPAVHIDEIADRCRAFSDELTKAGIDLTIVPAAEVSLPWALDATEADLRLASYGQRGSSVLIETPLDVVAGLPGLLQRIQLRGYRVTLAHPERARYFQERTEDLFDLVTHGVQLEVNADAIMGNPRRSRSARLGRALCARGMVSVVASDAHTADGPRGVGLLRAASERLEQMFGSDTALGLTSAGPVAVLAGGRAPSVEVMAPGVRRNRIRKIFRTRSNVRTR